MLVFARGPEVPVFSLTDVRTLVRGDDEPLPVESLLHSTADPGPLDTAS